MQPAYREGKLASVRCLCDFCSEELLEYHRMRKSSKSLIETPKSAGHQAAKLQFKPEQNVGLVAMEVSSQGPRSTIQGQGRNGPQGAHASPARAIMDAGRHFGGPFQVNPELLLPSAHSFDSRAGWQGRKGPRSRRGMAFKEGPFGRSSCRCRSFVLSCSVGRNVGGRERRDTTPFSAAVC
jgi:hypothetical protein